MGSVASRDFLDVLQWWDARKFVLPADYKMACDYFAIPATSTPCERVNSVAGREYSSTRQSLSAAVFIPAMCLRSWMKTRVLEFPSNRERALKSLSTGLTEEGEVRRSSQAHVSTESEVEFDGIEIGDDDSDEILGDGAINALNDEAECIYTDLVHSEF
jgi:hAT family C-terminal dimerisation region